MAGIGVFEFANMAATLLILRATDLLEPGRSTDSAVKLAVALYVVYNLAAADVSIPAGRLGDRRGMVPVLTGGVAFFALAYAGFALTGASIHLLAVLFAFAGVGIGCVETAEHATVATLAPESLRGSAFGLLAAVQSLATSPPARSPGCSTRSPRPPPRSRMRPRSRPHLASPSRPPGSQHAVRMESGSACARAASTLVGVDALARVHDGGHSDQADEGADEVGSVGAKSSKATPQSREPMMKTPPWRRGRARTRGSAAMRRRRRRRLGPWPRAPRRARPCAP